MPSLFSKVLRELKRCASIIPGLGSLRPGAGHRHETEDLVAVAYELQQQGRFKEALEVARRALADSNPGWLPHTIAGFALKRLGRPADASVHYRKAAELAPDDYAIARNLTEAVAESEGIKAAEAVYTDHCRRTGRKMDIAIAKISNVRDWARETGLALLDAGEAEEIPFEVPHVWNASDPPERYSAIVDKPYVAEIADARLFGECGIVLTADGTALSDNAGHPRFGRHVSFTYEHVVLGKTPEEFLLEFSDYETRQIDAGIFLVGSASNAFGHWFPDFLPKLQFLRQHPEFSRLPIIVDADMPPSHFDLLRRHADNELILVKSRESIRCGRLLVAPAPSFCPVEFLPNDLPVHELPGLSPRALRFLQSGIEPRPRAPRTGRWFLARRNMRWRRLLNEAEIVTELSQLGFQTAFLEDMDADAQVELFRNAEWIVAPNGSSLLNLIFSDPDVNLLILSQPGLFNWGTFQGPMRSLGYNPVWLCGEEAAAGNFKHADYAVPIADIREVLADMGMTENPPPKETPLNSPQTD